MRRVLVLSTVLIATGFELNSVPFAGGWGGDQAMSIGSAGSEALMSSAQTGTIKDDDGFETGIAAQVASLGKSDRLFVIRSGDAAADIAAIEPDGIARVDAEVQLTTGEFCEALAEAAEASDIPVAFFARLIWQESKFKHNARSAVGAQGVAQFMPRTATEMGLDNPFDPRQALPASARFLRKLHDQFGNLGLAAAAYNAGSGRIQNWLAKRGPLPDETRNYVRKITGNPAETWTSVKKTAALQQELPREAPCEGIGGLSRSKEVATMPVALKPGIADLIRKAEVEAARVAAATRAKARLLLAKAGKRKNVAPTIVAAADDKADRKTLVISMTKKPAATKVAALGRVKAKSERIRVASAAK